MNCVLSTVHAQCSGVLGLEWVWFTIRILVVFEFVNMNILQTRSTVLVLVVVVCASIDIYPIEATKFEL